MNLHQPKFHVSRDVYGDTNIHFGTRIGDDGKYLVALPATMEQRDFATVSPRVAPSPMITLWERDAPFALQSLMDALWQIGIRPSDIGTPGHLAATTKHLEDMRAIAFGKLELPPPAVSAS